MLTLFSKGDSSSHRLLLFVFLITWIVCQCENIPDPKEANNDDDNKNIVVYVLEGDNATLVCQNVSASNESFWRLPNNDFVMVGNDRNSSQSKYSMTPFADVSNAALTVYNVTLEDEGYYECFTQSVEDPLLASGDTQILLRVVEAPTHPRRCREVRLASIHPTIQCDDDVTQTDHVIFELERSLDGSTVKVASSPRPVFDVNKKLRDRLRSGRAVNDDPTEVLLHVCCVSIYLDKARSCGEDIRVMLAPTHPNPRHELEDTTNRDIIIIAVSASVVVFIAVVIVIFIYYSRLKKRQNRTMRGHRTMARGQFHPNSDSPTHFSSSTNYDERISNTEPYSSQLSTPNYDCTVLPPKITQLNARHEDSITHKHSALALFHARHSSTTCPYHDESNDKETGTCSYHLTASKQRSSFYKRFIPSNVSLRDKKNEHSYINSNQFLNGQFSSETTNRSEFETLSPVCVKGRDTEANSSQDKHIQYKNNAVENDGYMEMSRFGHEFQLPENEAKPGKNKKLNYIKAKPEDPPAYVNLIAFDAEKVLCDESGDMFNSSKGFNQSSQAIKSISNQSENANPYKKSFGGSDLTKLSSIEHREMFDGVWDHHKSTPELRIFDDDDVVEILNAGIDSRCVSSNPAIQKPYKFDHAYHESSPTHIEESAFGVSDYIENPKLNVNSEEFGNTSSFKRGTSQASIRRYFFNKRLTVISPRLDVPPKLPSKSRGELRHSNDDLCLGYDKAPLFMTSLPNIFNVQDESEVVYDVPRVSEVTLAKDMGDNEAIGDEVNTGGRISGKGVII